MGLKTSSVGALLRRCLFALCLVAAVCTAGVPSPVVHQFSFDGRFDHWAQAVDLLEYSYGGLHSMAADRVTPERPDIGVQINVNGPMPVGEFLYVKWRIKATGQVHEQRVDLRPLLPRDMTGHGLTFVIDGPQLYVYLITPRAQELAIPSELRTYRASYRVTFELYPTNTSPNR